MSNSILYIRENLPGGTDNYCKALYKMFKDDTECTPMPVADLPTVKSRLFHYYYRPAPLKEAIAHADTVHINGYTAMGTIQALTAAARQHKRVVYTAHWHPFQCLRLPFLGRLFFNRLMRPAIKRCAQVVTTINSEDTRFFQAFFPNVVQIPHWYNPLPMTVIPERKKNMILFVGRADDPVKGIEHLYALPKNEFEIHYVGKGKVERTDFIQHIGISDSELATLYCQASLLVVPSKYEAFSYAALEALTYGAPVLMSERVRIADYLQGIDGWQTFRYGNMEDFLNKVRTTIGTTVDKETVIKTFAQEKVKNKYRSIYLG